MKISKKTVADKMLDYFDGRLPLANLVDWAENALLSGDFPDAETDDLMAALGQIGLADVRNFGLAWEDSTAIMRKLGYRLDVRAAVAA